jgi:hypothetical protein
MMGLSPVTWEMPGSREKTVARPRNCPMRGWAETEGCSGWAHGHSRDYHP